MSVRNRLRRLEKVQADGDEQRLGAFRRCLDAYGRLPAVGAAVDHFWQRVQEAEARLGHEVTPHNLDEEWMEWFGLTEAVNRLFGALQEAEASTAGTPGGVA